MNLKKRYEIEKAIKEHRNAILEDVDHASVKNIINLAHKLLSAIDNVKSNASHAMINALTPDIDNLKKTLEDMVHNPTSYVIKKPVDAKKEEQKSDSNDKSVGK